MVADGWCGVSARILAPPGFGFSSLDEFQRRRTGEEIGSRMELFEQIRRDRRDSELSIRELAHRHGMHRRTVRQALASAVPPPRKPYRRRVRPAIDDWSELIDSWLIADQQAPRKQRHTARRVWQRLVAEHGATMSEATVTRYVRRRRSSWGWPRSR